MLTLGRVRGVPVVVSPSWTLVALLLTVVYGPLVDDAVADVDGAGAYAAAFAFSLLFAGCVLAHELGHTVISTALGYPVRRVVLLVLGGVSEIDGEPTRPRHELAIAASGPLVSLVIAAAGLGAHLATPAGSLASVLFALLAWTNLALAVFNLLPGLPLDGGHIVRAVVWACGASAVTSTRIAAWCGRVLAVLVAGTGLLALRGQAGTGSSLLVLFLAVYLWASATQTLRLADVRRTLPTVSVAALLRPGVLVPEHASVAEALRRVHDVGARGVVLTDAAQRPVAVVEERLVSAVAPERQAWTPARDVARPLTAATTLRPDVHRGHDGEAGGGLDATTVFEHMQRHPAPEYLVLTDAGEPAGIIATVDFARALNQRLRTGGRR
ncbi:Zn-dependent protease (includes SpoIVFB) [Jatrophihabitans endophyticus]|uniref:Zinc metalloprotease n=2 Tax=Jatrophihabitans endophyticus TaxID=1206085 RepID=A0A1M5BZL5_9ACTN|nr:Zn-dependent protease (includes SpoIVFB) [Jatrophihabitans endophyticus]